VLHNRRRVVQAALIWLLLELVAAAQVQRDREPLVFVWVHTLARPFTAAAGAVYRCAVDLSWGIRDTSRLIGENALLQRKLEEATMRQQLLERDVASLRGALTIASDIPSLARGCVVVPCTYRNLGTGLMEISAGTRSGLGRDMPVLSATGLVGRIVRVSESVSWVELVIRPGSAIAVRTAPGGLPGLLVGTGSGELHLEYVPSRAHVLLDTELVSSGADGVYPPGIPVARVSSVRESAGPFLEVRARAVVTLDALDLVMVVTSWHTHGSAETR
jgi:rod shape-determining protein MreC